MQVTFKLRPILPSVLATRTQKTSRRLRQVHQAVHVCAIDHPTSTTAGDSG